MSLLQPCLISGYFTNFEDAPNGAGMNDGMSRAKRFWVHLPQLRLFSVAAYFLEKKVSIIPQSGANEKIPPVEVKTREI